MTEAKNVEPVAQQDVISELLDKSFAARTVLLREAVLNQ